MNSQEVSTQTPDCPCQVCSFLDMEGSPRDCDRCTLWYPDYERYRRDIEGGLADESSLIRKEGPQEPSSLRTSSLRTSKIFIQAKGGDF